MKNVTIRHAAMGDLHDIVDMGQDFFDQSGFESVTTWDAESFLKTCIALLNGGVNGSLLVAEVDTLLVGMAGSIIFPFYFNLSLKLSQELFWFCAEDHRDGVGRALLDELEADARRKGAHIFISAQIAGHRDEAFARSYRMRGYTPMENSFVRKLSS